MRCPECGVEKYVSMGGKHICPKCGHGSTMAMPQAPAGHFEVSRPSGRGERGWGVHLLNKLLKRGGDRPVSSYSLERETLLRYLKGYQRIARLTYLGPSALEVLSNPVIADWLGKRGHNIVKEEPITDDCSPVIVPATDIHDYDTLKFRDFQWWFFRGEDMPWYKRGQMLLVFDFDLRNAKRALTFGFVFPGDADWLRFLLKVNRVTVVSGPQGSIVTPLTLDFTASGLKPIQKWLDSFGNGK